MEENLFQALRKRVLERNYRIDRELKNWVFDAFLDKTYEINAKITKILQDFGLSRPDLPVHAIKFNAEKIAFQETTLYLQISDFLEELYGAIKDYERTVESTMDTIRKFLHETEWATMEKIKTEDYILPIRRAKYVKARDELEKAKQAVKRGNWGEVLNHLRPAIDLAIKEKFGFKKIHPMWQFLLDAEKYDLPLPSYTMVYDYFDQGSHRIHEGKINTPWECEKALNFIAEFIDRLDLINVSNVDIEKFKKKSSAVD